MRHVRLGLGLLLVTATILTACNNGSNPTPPSSNGLKPVSNLTLEQADQVAETFLKAWGTADYATMYGLISPNSREAYDQAAFADEYDTVAIQMTLNTLDTHVASSLRQGTTAVVQYDVTFHTEMFGDIPSTDRLMRLIETPEGWRIAWSRMDILPDLAEGAQITMKRTMPGRGNIYDRNGQVLVDQNGRSILIYLLENDMADPDACINLMSRLLHREYSDVKALFDLYLPESRFLMGELDPETYKANEQALRDVCAVGDDANDTGTRTTRRYFGEIAPHIIGYIGPIQPAQLQDFERRGYPPDALVGQAGIEQSYEEQLAGKIGGQLVIMGPGGEILRTLAEVPAEPGRGVYLTIDRDLQIAVQDAFVEAYNLSQATWAPTSKGAAAVVMNVKTGEILALVSYPGFDPGLFNPDSPVMNRAEEIANLQNDYRAPLFNRATQGKFPAGSVFKIVSMAAGLDSGVYTEDTTATCSGTWYGEQYGDTLSKRTCWLETGHGTLNFPMALTYSCDAYFWQLGVALYNKDPKLLTSYAYRMGLGVATGQKDLPEEIGLIPNPDYTFQSEGRSWAVSDTLNLVIGQGQTQVTPLQITRMVSAIANGGTLYQPLFVNKIQLLDETPTIFVPTPTSSLGFDPSVYKLIQDAMCAVTTDPNGTARFIFQEWYDFQRDNGFDVVVCGKTGTAQTGGATVRPEAWFAAYAPQDDPQIAVVVMVENSCEGSEVAAPIVRRIIEDYYHMPHSEWPPLWQSTCSSLDR